MARESETRLCSGANAEVQPEPASSSGTDADRNRRTGGREVALKSRLATLRLPVFPDFLQ